MNETNQNGGELELSREVEAIQIPSGDTFKLPAGTKVIITQSLGGTYTVATDQGLARISDKDSDALGIKEEKVDQTEWTTHTYIYICIAHQIGSTFLRFLESFDPSLHLF